MTAEELLASRSREIEALCRRYSVRRLRLFGSALGTDWNEETSDFDFLADFVRPSGMNAFDQYIGFVLDLENLLGRKVDVVDWTAAKNPFFRKRAEKEAKELYAA